MLFYRSKYLWKIGSKTKWNKQKSGPFLGECGKQGYKRGDCSQIPFPVADLVRNRHWVSELLSRKISYSRWRWWLPLKTQPSGKVVILFVCFYHNSPCLKHTSPSLFNLLACPSVVVKNDSIWGWMCGIRSVEPRCHISECWVES